MPTKTPQNTKKQQLLRRVIIAEVALIGFIGVAALIFVLWYWPRQKSALPEKAELADFASETLFEDVDTQAPLPETLPTAQSGQIDFPVQSVDEILLAPTATPLPPGVPPPEPVCGGPEQMLILAIGIDSRADNYQSGLADVMRIVRVDFINPRVSVISMPRDLWVEIPGIADHNDITHGKLNQAYFYGLDTTGYYDGEGGGPGLLTETLDLNFKIKPENYITLNMFALERMIDAVDGIDVYVPYDVDGKSTLPDDPFDLGYYERGYHHFDGETAINFARIRLIDSVFDRDERQSLVLHGLREKILSPYVLPHIPQLILIFLDSVQTDLSPTQIRQLTCIAPQIDRTRLQFVNFPRQMFSDGRVYVPSYEKELFIWEADFDTLTQLLDLFQKGFWPQ